MDEASPAPNGYLKASEVARRLGVSPKTVDRWANQGLIPHIVTLGGHRRFTPAAVAAVVEEMKRRGGGDPTER